MQSSTQQQMRGVQQQRCPPQPPPAARALRRVQRSLAARVASRDSEVQGSEVPVTEDPEAQFRRYGKQFGGKYTLQTNNNPFSWLNQAPRVRVRTVEDRKLDELLDLAVLNARLNGMPGWEVRRRLDFLKTKRRNWEAIYHYITETEATATLEAIEEANAKVEQLLDEASKDPMGVDAMQRKLVSLQEEVDAAAEKLRVTQARVEQNLKRVNELKAEAAALERLRVATPTVAPPEGVTTQQPEPARPSKMLPIKKRNRGLQSSLEMEPALRNFWYPAAFSKDLSKDMMIPFDLFGESWVMFRDERGQPACIKDTCAHRSCPLSLGKVKEGQVVCAYHGWEFNGDGHCTKMPSTSYCRNVAVAALPCAEKDGFIWVWPGNCAPKEELPSFTAPPPGFQIHSELVIEVPVEHGLLVENLLDLAHAPFTHTSTFARGWPVPDIVKFQATRMLSGHWDPYPINMSFQPPCCTISHIGLDQVGGRVNKGGRSAEDCPRHLHQLHVCMPSKRGHTRLLYRMSMDFMGWARHVPGIQALWKQVAAQVMGEDLVLVVGQQDRMAQGEDTWANPMSYDKLAVRYRRWRNSLAEGNLAESQRLAATAAMSAGQLFEDGEEANVLHEAAADQAASHN